MSIYLDNAATTKPCQAAAEAIFYGMLENYGNPSSLHRAGLKAELAVTEARKSIAAALVCDPACVYFTSGATESNNLALFGAAKTYGRRKKKIVSTAVEHSSVENSLKQLEEMGFEVVRVPPRRGGEFDADDLISTVDENTCLISCMMVNNETGCILPIKRVFAAVKREYPECITHCDAVQGFLKLPIKSTELYADMISVSAHKVHGAKGVGALFLKKGVRLSPILYGGGQEKGLRPGTESVPLIMGFGAAVRALLPALNQSARNAGALNSYLRQELSKLSEVSINSPESASPFILNCSVLGFRSETLLHFLEEREIYVSSGSACSKGAKSTVLKEFGATDREVDSALRISLSRESTKGEIDALIKGIRDAQATLAKAR